MVELTDILTEPEAATALNVSDIIADTAQLAMAVSAVSGAIDAACGPVVARKVTEIHAGGSRSIWPHQAPVLSVTSIAEFDGTIETVLTDESAFGTVGGTSGFTLDPSGHRIERRSGGSSSTFPAGAVQVVYEAGRFATTVDVSAKFKQAAANILRRVWKREGSAWAFSPDFYANAEESVSQAGFFRAVQPMIDEWLWDERQGTQSVIA